MYLSNHVIFVSQHCVSIFLNYLLFSPSLYVVYLQISSYLKIQNITVKQTQNPKVHNNKASKVSLASESSLPLILMEHQSSEEKLWEMLFFQASREHWAGRLLASSSVPSRRILVCHYMSDCPLCQFWDSKVTAVTAKNLWLANQFIRVSVVPARGYWSLHWLRVIW